MEPSGGCCEGGKNAGRSRIRQGWVWVSRYLGVRSWGSEVVLELSVLLFRERAGWDRNTHTMLRRIPRCGLVIGQWAVIAMSGRSVACRSLADFTGDDDQRAAALSNPLVSMPLPRLVYWRAGIMRCGGEFFDESQRPGAHHNVLQILPYRVGCARFGSRRFARFVRGNIPNTAGMVHCHRGGVVGHGSIPMQPFVPRRDHHTALSRPWRASRLYTLRDNC